MKRQASLWFAVPVVCTAAAAWFLEVQAAAPGKMPAVKFGVEKCAPTVLAKTPGELLQAVLKSGREGVVWELEVEARDGKLYDIECSATTGKIVETETRVKSADDPAFKAKAKVSEADAKATALAKHPGTVTRIEYEFESDGAAVYELDIRPASGPDMRVEVDAGTGKIVEASIEHLEIGRI